MAILNARNGITYYNPRTEQHRRQAWFANTRNALNQAIALATFPVATSKGQPIYIDVTGNAQLARANQEATSFVAGFAAASVPGGSVGAYLRWGPIALADWTAIAGVAALTPGVTYYLSAAAAGTITSNAPDADSEVTLEVGYAETSEVLNVRIQQGIYL